MPPEKSISTPTSIPTWSTPIPTMSEGLNCLHMTSISTSTSIPTLSTLLLDLVTVCKSGGGFTGYNNEGGFTGGEK